MLKTKSAGQIDGGCSLGRLLWEEATVPLCLYRSAHNGGPRLGLIDGDRLIGVAVAGGFGASVVATDNQGCIMHLRGGCDAGKRPLQVRHIAEVVAERLWAMDNAGN